MIYLGLLLFFLLDYVRPTSFFPQLELLHLNSLVPIGVVLGTMLTKDSRKTAVAIPGEPSNIGMLGAFLGLIVLSAAFADVTERVYNVFITVVGYVFIAWAIRYQATDLDRLKGIIKALVVVHLIVAALNPLMFTDPDVRHYVTSGAFLGDGNDFALSVNVAIPLVLFLFTESRTKRHKLVWGLAFVVLVTCVVLTKSRGGTVALVCMGLYYWSKSDKKLVSAVAGIAVVGVIMLTAPPSYFQRMGSITDSQEGSTQGRLQAWSGGIRMAIDYPLTGVGAGHFPIAYGTTYRLSLDIPWQTAHSIYFLSLGELGFPGLALLLMIIFRNIFANRRMLKHLAKQDAARVAMERRLIVAMNAALIAFASGGAFLSALYYPHMYVLAGLLTASRQLVYVRTTQTDAAAVPATVRSPSRLLTRGGISAEWAARPGLGQLSLPSGAGHKK